MGAKRSAFSLDEKYKIYLHMKENTGLDYHQITSWVYKIFNKNISRTSVYRIKGLSESSFEKVNLSRKKIRRVKFPEIEQALKDFILKYQEKTIITDDILLAQAMKLRHAHGIDQQELSLSNGWLQKFKERNNIRSIKLCGEAGMVNEEDLRKCQIEIEQIISKYKPEDVFNFDETALFYRLKPDRTLSMIQQKGNKKSKIPNYHRSVL